MTVVTTTSANGGWKIHTGTLQEVLDAISASVGTEVTHVSGTTTTSTPVGRSGNVVNIFVNGAGFSALVRN